MNAVIEIIIDGAKKFGGEIIAGILLAVALWLFPGLRKIFRKKDDSSEEIQKLLEAIEARRKEEERLKEELRQHKRALKQANPQGDEQIYRQLEEELRQAEAQRQEESNRREEIQRQLEALRKSDEGFSNYHKAANFAVIFVVVLMAFVGMWSLIYPADTETGEQTLEIIKRITDKYRAEKVSGYFTTLHK